MAKLLLLLETQQVDSLEDHLRQGLEAQFGKEEQVAVQLMRAVPDDIFYRQDSPFPRPQILLELIVALLFLCVPEMGLWIS